MKNEDRNLVDRIKMGDEIAFKELFYLYSNGLFVWSHKITRDVSASEDIVQNFFISFWERREVFPMSCSFKTYAYKAIYNASLNYLRDNERFIHGYEITINMIDNHVNEDDLQELKRLLLRAIDELPDRCKKIFVMATFEKKKYSEVADQLGISVNTVKVQVSKAYRILKQKIG